MLISARGERLARGPAYTILTAIDARGRRGKIMLSKKGSIGFSDVKLKSNRRLPERCGLKSTIQIAKNRKNRFLPEEIAFFVFLMNFSGPNTCQSA